MNLIFKEYDHYLSLGFSKNLSSDFFLAIERSVKKTIQISIEHHSKQNNSE